MRAEMRLTTSPRIAFGTLHKNSALRERQSRFFERGRFGNADKYQGLSLETDLDVGAILYPSLFGEGLGNTQGQAVTPLLYLGLHGKPSCIYSEDTGSDRQTHGMPEFRP